MFLWVAVVLFAGCGSILPSVITPKPPDINYNIRETSSSQPQIIKTPNGDAYIYPAVQKTYEIGLERKDHPVTLWQRFTNWLGSFSILAILGLIAGVVLAPGATGMFLVNKYFAVKKALKQTVAGIEEAKAQEKLSEDVKTALAINMDASSKKIVDDLKRA